MKFKIFKPNGVLAGYENNIKLAQECCDRQKGWYYELPKNIGKEELKQHVIWLCINKQLEKYGYTYSDVKKGARYEFFTVGTIEKKRFLWLFSYKKTSYRKVVWYQHLTFKTKEDFENWKTFCIETFIRELKLTKERAEYEFAWLNLAYGLKEEIK